VARSSTGFAGALGVRVRRLQYSVAMYAARSRTSASGVGRSNVAPCTFLCRLWEPFGFERVVVVRAPWSSFEWQPGLLDLPGPESRAVSSRCRHLHVGRVVVMAGLTLSLNLHAHRYMCKSGRGPGYTLPLTPWWQVVCV
jgi:hypothetical protein